MASISATSLRPGRLLRAPLAPDADDVVEGGLLMPWEECEVDNRGRTFPKGTSNVIVLWLPATSFDPKPLTRLAGLIDALTNGLRDRIDVKVLGPANSTGLQNIVREVRDEKWRSAPSDALDGLTMISARATASDAMLLYDPSGSAPNDARFTTVRALLEEKVPRGPRGGFHFVRTIATDDVVLRQLIAELKLRRVPVESRSTEEDDFRKKVSPRPPE